MNSGPVKRAPRLLCGHECKHTYEWDCQAPCELLGEGEHQYSYESDSWGNRHRVPYKGAA